MIDLTPLEVRQKKGDFRRAMRGYEPALVDDFLDLVAERLEALVRENRAVSEDVARLREQVAEFKERERALTEALVTAQEMREELRRQAEKDADLLRREAEADIAQQRAELLSELEREEQALLRARARRGQFLKSFRTFLERELNEIAVVEETIMVEPLEPAEPAAEPTRAAAKKKGAKSADAAAPAPAAPEATAENAAPKHDDLPLDEPPGLDWLSSVLREER